MSVSHTFSLTSASSRGSSAIEENYSVVKRIGSGAFADVKEVKQKNAKKHFAWKQVSLEKDPHCANEAEILSGLKHQGIVEIIDFFSKDGVIDMLLELCTKGSMSQYIDKHYESLPFTPHKVSQVSPSTTFFILDVCFLSSNQSTFFRRCITTSKNNVPRGIYSKRLARSTCHLTPLLSRAPCSSS